MKKAEIKLGMEVAVVRSENWGADYGIVIDTNASKRVYHGSRDFSGSMSNGGFISVKIVRNGVETDRIETVRPNQIKDAAEQREIARAKQERKQSVSLMLARQKSDSESAVEILRARGLKSAKVHAVTAYRDYRITGWTVELSAKDALEIAGTWSKDA